jgi:CBS domain-containing protein
MVMVMQILQIKGNDVWTISPHETVYEALKLMADKEIGALIVTDKGKVVGIFSERDYARKVILEGRSSKETLVKDIMTERVIGINIDTTVETCMQLMTEGHFRHLPVMDGNRLIGVVSIGDVVKSIITDQGHLIEQLENYILGR